MNASAKPDKRRPEAQDEDPAKGGIKPADDKTHPSGDAMQHAVDEAANRKPK